MTGDFFYWYLRRLYKQNIKNFIQLIPTFLIFKAQIFTQ